MDWRQADRLAQSAMEAAERDAVHGQPDMIRANDPSDFGTLYRGVFAMAANQPRRWVWVYIETA